MEEIYESMTSFKRVPPQVPSSSNRILKITNPDETEPFPKFNASHFNSSDSKSLNSKEDIDPPSYSSQLDVDTTSPTHAPEPIHVQRSRFCHNCRTLGVLCSAVRGGTKCDRCLLMGMKCDLSGSGESQKATHTHTRHTDSSASRFTDLLNQAEIESKSESEVKGVREDCSRCGRSYHRDLSPVSGISQVLDVETRRLARYTVNSLMDQGLELRPGSERALFGYFATGRIPNRELIVESMYCRPCRVQSTRAWEARCLRGRDEWDVVGGKVTETLQVSKTAKNCAGCFDRKLDHGSAENFCETCREVIRRCVLSEEEIVEEDEESWLKSGKTEEPKVLRVVNVPDTSVTETTSRLPNKQLVESETSDSETSDHDYQDCNPLDALATEDDQTKNSNKGHDYHTQPQSTTENQAFQSCISCLQNEQHCEPCTSFRTNQRLCDQDLPSCTECEIQGKKCSYRYLVNTRRTEPVRYFDVPRTCFWCSQGNVRIGISGLCSACEAVRDESIESVSGDTSSSSEVQSTNPEHVRVDRARKVRFLDSSQQLKPQNEGLAIINDAEVNAKSKPSQHLIQPLPISSTGDIPFPGFTTPCLGCSDTAISCAIHPSSSSSSSGTPSIRNTSSSKSTKCYTPLPIPLSIRSNLNYPTTNPLHLCPTPETDTPCLSCLDINTKCARHLHSASDNNNIQVAQACGSCRFAGRKCDGKKPNCGQCDRRRLECLFIRGNLGNLEVEDGERCKEKGSEATPVHTSTSTSPPSQEQEPSTAPESPRIPLSCGGCRIAKTKCDGARPGCSSCKGKGLECLYITGQPFADQEATMAQHKHAYTRPSKPLLANSPLLIPSSSALPDEDPITELNVNMQESQIVDSNPLAAPQTEKDVVAAVEVGKTAEEEEEESEGESEEWDVVSVDEEYDIVDL